MKATYEVLFTPGRHFTPNDLAAEVLRAVHPAIQVVGVHVIDRTDAPGVRLDLSMFANEAEIDDHAARFRNITGVPPHDVFIIRRK